MAFSLLLDGVSITFSVFTFETFLVPNGDAGVTAFSGVDGRGEEEGLPFAVAVEETPALKVDLGTEIGSC